MWWGVRCGDCYTKRITMQCMPSAMNPLFLVEGADAIVKFFSPYRSEGNAGARGP